MAEMRVNAIEFGPEAMVISFIELPTDVRVGGQVAVQRQIQLSMSHVDYAADADLLHGQAVRAIKNALEDFESSEPFNPEIPDPDDERGMGE